MKRKIALFFILCCCTFFVVANSSSSKSSFVSYEDSFSFMLQNPQYVELYKQINNCMPESSVESCYEELRESLGTTAQDWMILMKASLNCAYYHLELSSTKNSKRAKELITYSYDIYDALKDFGVSERLLLPLYFCCLSMDYLAHPLKITTALESLKIIDDAYKKYPTELAIANLYASRRLNAPAIGGGNASEAFEIFSSIVAFINYSESSTLSPWECFDAYKGIASCYEKHKDKDNAILYYKKALAIYSTNTQVSSALSKIQK